MRLQPFPTSTIRKVDWFSSEIVPALLFQMCSFESIGAFKVEVLRNLAPVELPVLVASKYFAAVLQLIYRYQTSYTACIPPRLARYSANISRTQSTSSSLTHGTCYGPNERMERVVHACCPYMPSCCLCSRFL